MTGSGSPCGACKFLRRKCVKGCVFAPYFCHEQGATHFAAIHKVFGASNVSKLLAHLPVSDRCEAAVTISYEAQARLQDPIYGCVSHIFALQQQVVNLQAQLASLKELQASQSIMNSSGNPNNGDQKLFHQDHVELSFQGGMMMPQFDSSSYGFNGSLEDVAYCAMNNYPPVKYENSYCENTSFDSMSINERQWPFQDDADELQSAAFRYFHHS
ncbi:LOB domain-containing protein 29-like [Andrographis paniculata]|uniref:LOB domain-containing protein 29-like n=1 Tax=Andrographis paniculata TaxID=175694 RepID=UPI0021E8A780|nr:LOB domain-containing protein 29-like [Andrographis paniculata]